MLYNSRHFPKGGNFMIKNSNNFKPVKINCSKYESLKTIEITEEEYNQLKQLCKPPSYIIFDNKTVGVLIKNKAGFFIKIFMSYAEVVRKEVNKDTHEATIRIRYFDGLELREDVFSSEILTKNGIKELLIKGIRFDEKDASFVIDFLLKSESLADTIKSYTKYGWFYDDNELIFLSNELLGNDKLKSKFVCQDILDLTPTGSLEIWTDMVQNEVCNNIPLEFVLASSFASPILALLNMSYDFGSIVINFANTSSKGKTTAAMLAASVFSNPQLNRGTAISFNATENALQEHIAKCNGLSVIIDEAAVCVSLNLQKLLYSFSTGRSKMRLNGDSTPKEVKEFSSVIFSTAEFNFVDDESPEGLRTRVFEITDSLTRNAKNSDNIKRTVIKNYALDGNLFINHLIGIGDNKIISDYELTKAELINQYSGSQKISDNKNLTDRILSKLAIILLSAKYSNEVFTFNFNTEKLTTFIIELTNKIVDIPSPEEELLTVVYEDVLKNFKKYRCSYTFIKEVFGIKTLEEVNLSVFNNGIVGLIRNSKEKGYFELCINEYYFKKLMNRSDINDFRKRLKNLRADGRLVAQKDRQISKVCLVENMPKANAYIFKFPIEKKDEMKDTYIEEFLKTSETDELLQEFLVDDEEPDLFSDCE